MNAIELLHIFSKTQIKMTFLSLLSGCSDNKIICVPSSVKVSYLLYFISEDNFLLGYFWICSKQGNFTWARANRVHSSLTLRSEPWRGTFLAHGSHTFNIYLSSFRLSSHRTQGLFCTKTLGKSLFIFGLPPVSDHFTPSSWQQACIITCLQAGDCEMKFQFW